MNINTGNIFPQAVDKPPHTRSLDAIITDLRGTLKAGTINIIKSGRLLIQAKELVGHGNWLQWLEENFSLSDQTAENYMKAARVADKYDPEFQTIGNVSPSALYNLAYHLRFDEEDGTIPAVLEEARQKRVGRRRAQEIAHEVFEAGVAAREAEEEEKADAGDGPGVHHDARGREQPAHKARRRTKAQREEAKQDEKSERFQDSMAISSEQGFGLAGLPIPENLTAELAAWALERLNELVDGANKLIARIKKKYPVTEREGNASSKTCLH